LGRVAGPAALLAFLAGRGSLVRPNKRGAVAVDTGWTGELRRSTRRRVSWVRAAASGAVRGCAALTSPRGLRWSF
jgi:hypothetical protein